MAPLIAQLVWCALGIAVALLFWRGGRIEMAAGFLAASVLYAALSIVAFKGLRWAWWLALLPPVLLVICLAPWAIYNFYAFLTDHPKYLDSPATIFIVAINSAVLLVPAVVVVILMVSSRRRANRTVEPSEQASRPSG